MHTRGYAGSHRCGFATGLVGHSGIQNEPVERGAFERTFKRDLPQPGLPEPPMRSPRASNLR